MSTRSSIGWLIAVVPVSFLLGSAGGYELHDQLTEAQVAGLKLEISRLKEVADHPAIDRPPDHEATAAIPKPGRSMEVSECKPRQAVPGVTCTGIITTTAGTFAGSKQPGVLSFAKIGGRWEKVQ